jgi:hypothetical protein
MVVFVNDGAIDCIPVDPDDLALNRAGATLRQKSAEIKDAYPARVFLAKVLGVHNSERAWRRGAMSEEEVASRLERLGNGWHVIHSVPVGANDADIDHVVIGPPGVFTLNTKNHLGKKVTVYEKVVYVNGTKQFYITNSRHEGKRSTKLLSAACDFPVTVMPVIVIMASQLAVKKQPDDVAVVSRRKIASWLADQASRPSPSQVESIYAAARRRPTWKI